MNKEEAAFIVGYRYRDDGAIVNPKGLSLRISSIENKRYPQFSFKYDGKKYYVRMHRFAAYCIYGDALYDADTVVRHLNDDKSDIRRENIALGTQVDNMADIPDHKKQEIDERRSATVKGKNIRPPRITTINDDKLPEIIAQLDEGKTYRYLADKYNVHHSTIYYINKVRRNAI